MEIGEKMKKISILGSTGSIGTQTLSIVRDNRDIEVLGLAAHSQIDVLLEQILEFKPRFACVFEKEKAVELKKKLQGTDCEVLCGMEGLKEIASIPEVDIVITAIVGMIGIEPTIAAIQSGKDIALANKETLVCAGHIIMPLAKEYGVRILPVDSEHSAIFQCLQGNAGNKIHRILLTASGGPFRGYRIKDLEHVTPKQALKHPNWSMGRKITIDSSTMVNKGLEVMEAKWLFDVKPEDIKVLIQPTSVIHSMVEFVDGAVMAQLGTPDMKLPIQYALYYPNRLFLKGERLDFDRIASIEFAKPDLESFQGLALAFEAIKIGGSMPTVYNAVNEVAVARFLNREIAYLDIARMIHEAMNAHMQNVIANPKLEEIIAIKEELELKKI